MISVVTGVTTASSFIVGNLTGDVTGNADTATTATNAQGLTGTPDITVTMFLLVLLLPHLSLVMVQG